MQKEFKFNDITDYIFYLSELIVDLLQKTNRLKNYKDEIQQIISLYPDEKFIQSELYETISDKVNRLFQYLFNLLGDESKKAVSYRKYRKILYKNKNSLGIVLNELSQNELEILAELNTDRNWGLHIPESLYIQKKELFKMDNNFTNKYNTTIPIPFYEYYEIQFLNELNREIQEVLTASMTILERMKSDYSALIGKEVKIEYEINKVKQYWFMNAVKNSLNAQKGKA